MNEDLQNRIDAMPFTEESKQRLFDTLSEGGYCQVDYKLRYTVDPDDLEYVEDLDVFSESVYPFHDPEQALFALVDTCKFEGGDASRVLGQDLDWDIAPKDISYDEEFYSFEKDTLARHGFVSVTNDFYPGKDDRLYFTSYDDVMNWYDAYKERVREHPVERDLTTESVQSRYLGADGNQYYEGFVPINGQIEDVLLPKKLGGTIAEDYRKYMMIFAGRTVPMVDATGEQFDVRMGKTIVDGTERYGLVRTDGKALYTKQDLFDSEKTDRPHFYIEKKDGEIVPSNKMPEEGIMSGKVRGRLYKNGADDLENAKSVSFKSSHGNHAFTKRELYDLLLDKEVTIKDFQTKAGEVKPITGKLLEQKYMGRPFVGFGLTDKEKTRPLPEVSESVTVDKDGPDYR